MFFISQGRINHLVLFLNYLQKSCQFLQEIIKNTTSDMPYLSKILYDLRELYNLSKREEFLKKEAVIENSIASKITTKVHIL